MNPIRLTTYNPYRGRVDRENHILFGVSAMQAVEALGHNLIIDQTSLQQFANIANTKPRGLKSRYTHPGLSSDGLGKFVGRMTNFVVQGDKVIGDILLSTIAAKSPEGNLRDYLESLAEEAPDMFGMSVVIHLDEYWRLDDGTEVPASTPEGRTKRPQNAKDKYPVARITQAHAVDFVDEPAANRDGLFSAFSAFNNTTSLAAASLFSTLDEILAHYHITPATLPDYIQDYFSDQAITPTELIDQIDAIRNTFNVTPAKAHAFAYQYLAARSRPQPTLNSLSVFPKPQPKGDLPMFDTSTATAATLTGQPGQPQPDGKEWLDALQSTASQTILANSGLPKASQDKLKRGRYSSPAELQTAITDEQTYLAKLAEDQVIQLGPNAPRGRVQSMTTAADDMANAVDWLFGAPGAKLPAPHLRSAKTLYEVLTGDYAWRDIFDPAYALASATPTTLPGLAVSAMNKVIVGMWDTLTAYRWYELVAVVQPNDGSLQDMNWISFGGLSNLSVVSDGGAYTEKTVADSKESDAYVKHGNYVGISRKMLRNSQIAQIQAVPRALAIAAVRTRSANIANIFTQASGVGPTLDQDSTALFHANHSNVATTAYSITAWKAARLECYKQTELGSSKRQGLWPKFWLGPADLYDTALIDFGYGAGPGGYTGTANNDVNPYAMERPGDPRPTVIAVPEFTDTGDWAYLADPNMHPVIQMSYSQNPGGNTHPLPELFSVVSETAGLMFTNDTMPVKVRDEYAFGVSTYRGIGKRNVA